MTRPPELVYDLRYASDHFLGIGTHAHGLLSALLEAPGAERIRVIWGRGLPCTRFALEPLRNHPRADWVETGLPPLGWRTAAGTGALLRRLGGNAYLSPFWLLPDRCPMPAVLTLHDVLPLAVPGTVAWWRRPLFSIAVDRAGEAAAVLASSEYTRAEIARLTSVPAERVRVVPLGVAPPSPIAERPAGVPDGPFALVVGINRPHKNLAVLARAWSRLGPGAPLALVWAGRQDPRFASPTAATSGARITALGHVPQAALEWLYRNATMVLFPTRYEGFGLPLLEAAARGAPVIASDLAVLRETGEGVARFVPADDEAAWAAAIRELAPDAAARAAMREAGLERAAEYSFARCARRTLEIVREVALRP